MERQKIISRDVIEQHAEELFVERGVEKASVNEIVKRAGIAKGTFYLYFKNKDELVDAIIGRYTKAFLEQVLLPHGENLKIKALSEDIIDYFNENRFYLVELRRNLMAGSSYSSTAETVDAFRSLITVYINEQEEYRISDWDTYTRVLLGMILDVSYRAIIEGDEGGAVMLGDILKRFFSCT